MRIAVGSLQQESNTLTSRKRSYDDFTIIRGVDMLSHISVMEFFLSVGAEVIPTLYANAVPGGPLKQRDFQSLAGELVSGIPRENIDGVWLYLHGALEVEDIGSGELALLRMVRRQIGSLVPVALVLDFHANNTHELMSLVNVVVGYRTAPHRDMVETEIRTARILIHCIINKLLPRPQITRVPVVVPGDCVLTDEEPLRSVMQGALELEKEEGMLVCNVFNGQPWVDAPHMGPSTVCIHEKDPYRAKQAADHLARHFFESRHDFHFSIEAFEPSDALDRAYRADVRPVFITDSGDNTTAGSSGDNAFLLDLLLRKGFENVMLGGITDAIAVSLCHSAELGDVLTLEIGGSIEPSSTRIRITGELLFKGDIEGWYGENSGSCAVVRSQGIDIIITANRCALIRPRIFTGLGLDLESYKFVVVKLGYLFPELAQISKRTILAFTTGCSTERLQDMNMKNIQRPVFPLDDGFVPEFNTIDPTAV